MKYLNVLDHHYMLPGLNLLHVCHIILVYLLVRRTTVVYSKLLCTTTIICTTTAQNKSLNSKVCAKLGLHQLQTITSLLCYAFSLLPPSEICLISDPVHFPCQKLMNIIRYLKFQYFPDTIFSYRQASAAYAYQVHLLGMVPLQHKYHETHPC